jgi:hypothetical protein
MDSHIHFKNGQTLYMQNTKLLNSTYSMDKENKVIHKDYDEMTGVGSLTTNDFMVAKSGGFLMPKVTLEMRLYVSSVSSGKHYFFVFNKTATGWSLLKNQSFFALIDGERFSTEGKMRNHETFSDGSTVWCAETMTVEFDAATFEKMASATSIKIRVAGADHELDSTVKAAIKEMSEAAKSL